MNHAIIGVIITGCMMILANIVFAGVISQNQNLLVIPFRDGNIILSFGWSFYLCLGTGLFCIIAGSAYFVFYKYDTIKEIVLRTGKKKIIISPYISNIIEMEDIKKQDVEATDVNSTQITEILAGSLAKESPKGSSSSSEGEINYVFGEEKEQIE